MKQKYVVKLITSPAYEASHITMYRKGNPAMLLGQLLSMLITAKITPIILITRIIRVTTRITT